ncbi:MAG: beta-N-acetylglucosaminidase domain-containing protein [Bacteroidota bacterium]|nr:beta-N-acetylglucosaminidase domain-containing protein [Bacteroidota bacterium]
MVYRKHIIILVFILIVTLFFSCKRKDKVILNQAAWSSKDPIAIPFVQRNNQKSAENLVFNPSFEIGKIYYEKNNIKSFDVTGWKKIGENVHWVDTEINSYADDEVFDGTHAIKIFRSKTDETEDLGVGIISDYIKVIPGNYSLSLYLKLENICPNRARLGTKLHDAVNIRLQFFDKNKIEISSDEYDPFRHTKIDNAFKSLNLTNYWNISQFGWGKVNAQSAKYPFLNGDIPDETRYVKIFIGLKGTGTMWVDKVNFNYTKQNFTFLERMKPYFDSSFTAYELLLPQPQYIKKLEPSIFYSNKRFPIILIPNKPQEKTLLAAQKIKDVFDDIFSHSLESYSSNNVKILTHINHLEINEKNNFIVSIGNTSVFNTYRNLLPDSLIKDKEQGYFINQLNEAPNIVFLWGNDDEGNYNAALTFNQLLDEKEFLYYSADIIDYPDFVQRGFLLHEYSGTLDQMEKNIQYFSDHKLNHAYFEVYDDNSNYYPFQNISTQFFIGKTSAMIDLLKFNYTNHPDIDYSSQQNDFRQKTTFIANKISALTHPGLENILIKGDYFQSYNSSNPEWIKFYTNEDISINLQKYHIDLLNKLTKTLNVNLEFMPPWSRLDFINMGMGQAEFYYRDLTRNITSNIPFYWTGGSYCSPSIDYAEWFRMNKLVKTNPVLFDNSLNYSLLRFRADDAKSYYVGKLRTLSLFEPLKADYPDHFHQLNNRGKVVLNIDYFTKLNIIKTLTAANYYWNTENYNADKTIWKLLVKYYGQENAKNLVYFNDAYFGLKESTQKIKNNGVNNKNSHIANQFLEDLNYYSGLLEKEMAEKDLLYELIQFKNELVNDYQSFLSTQNY